VAAYCKHLKNPGICHLCQRERAQRVAAVMTPTATFAPYVKDAISEQLAKASPEPRDVIERRLWAAAQYDHHTKNGAICSMIDSGGLALVDCSEYKAIIDAGLKQYAEAGF